MNTYTSHDVEALDEFIINDAHPMGFVSKLDMTIKKVTVNRLVRLGLARFVLDKPAVPSGASNWASPSAWAAELTESGVALLAQHRVRQ